MQNMSDDSEITLSISKADTALRCTGQTVLVFQGLISVRYR